MLAVWAAPVSADPHYSYSGGYPPDLGTYHTYCYDDTITDGDDPALYERIRRAEVYLENNTNVNVRLGDPCDEVAPATDVMWHDADIISYGEVHCLWRNSNDLCDHHLSTINKSSIEDDAAHINYQYRKTACHELGHTVTLSHYSGSDPPDPMTRNDCMKRGIWDDGSTNSHTYASHHINSHINDWFCTGCTIPDLPAPGLPIPLVDSSRGGA